VDELFEALSPDSKASHQQQYDAISRSTSKALDAVLRASSTVPVQVHGSTEARHPDKCELMDICQHDGNNSRKRVLESSSTATPPGDAHEAIMEKTALAIRGTEQPRTAKAKARRKAKKTRADEETEPAADELMSDHEEDSQSDYEDIEEKAEEKTPSPKEVARKYSEVAKTTPALPVETPKAPAVKDPIKKTKFGRAEIRTADQEAKSYLYVKDNDRSRGYSKDLVLQTPHGDSIILVESLEQKMLSGMTGSRQTIEIINNGWYIDEKNQRFYRYKVIFVRTRKVLFARSCVAIFPALARTKFYGPPAKSAAPKSANVPTAKQPSPPLAKPKLLATSNPPGAEVGLPLTRDHPYVKQKAKELLSAWGMKDGFETGSSDSSSSDYQPDPESENPLCPPTPDVNDALALILKSIHSFERRFDKIEAQIAKQAPVAVPSDD